MIKNYFKVAVRNMVRNKLFTIINILGMSVSLACCTVLFIYTNNELRFDSHHGEDVYRLTSNLQQIDKEVIRVATSSVPIAPVIQEEIPEIMHAARITGSSMFGSKNVIRYKEHSWFIENGYIADTGIFRILKFDVISGNFNTPLPHHNAIALDKTWVKTIFGDKDPMGKTIKLNTNFGVGEFEVTSVYDNSSFNAHLKPSYFISMSNNQWDSFFNVDKTNWVGNNMVYTYLKLIPGSDAEKVDGLIHEVFLQNGSEQMKAMGLSKEMDLQPVRSVHTDTDFMINISNTTDRTFIYVLGSIGVLILILACINYINLSTARAGRRALEVGVRKVIGVTPGNLICQFLGESFILVFVSMILGIGLVKLVVPYFNQLINNPIAFDWSTFSELVIYLVAFLIITGIIAGFYPAFYLSGVKPSAVLKGRSSEKSGSAVLRKSLVILQFVISISLISAIIIISDQMDFIKNKDLGFSADSKLIIPLSSDESANNYKLLKTKLESNAKVYKVSGSDGIPGSHIMNDLLVYKDGQTMDHAVHIYNNTVDLEFAQLLGLKLLSGSYFLDYEKDSLVDKVLISESGVRQLDISIEDAPGEMVHFDWEGRTYHFEIVGVVNDIHQFSLHKAMDPILYTIGSGDRYGYITVDADFTDFQDLISGFEKQWKSCNMETPFEYFVLDEHLMRQYVSDFNTFSMIRYFAIISIIISCLGLYAMSLFMAEKRYREIGIRKTFGASVGNIFTMVSSDLSKLIVIAFALSIPITWYGMSVWLETFAYKVAPGIDVYLIAGIISIGIGWFTIGYQSIKAAKTNPVHVLKDE
ncbi:MAG: ABC transporter permease [Cytophagales bacterium]|nr:ABC transporter permease [Cytophagales bacterium]